MASRAPVSASRPFALPRPPEWLADAALMLVVALALRCWWFGDPVIQTDEQFYLLVGDRMLHGAMPFVDIWDRKPIGLFLIYAAIRLLGGGGIVQYQLVACLFAGGAALLVTRIARLHASPVAARLAGVAALLWFITYDGAGGQAPIFYGPLVAGAALVTIRAVLDEGIGPRRLMARGLAAMLLLGLAIQVKYTALFEGIGLGLMLLWAGWRAGAGLRWLAGAGALWIAAALAPTALAYAAYAHAGWGDAFVQANFRSVFERGATSPATLLRRTALALACALPLLAAAVAALRLPTATPRIAATRRLIALWLVAAFVGFFSIGTLFQHYFLPVLLPLTALAAPALDARSGQSGRAARWWPAFLILALGACAALQTGLHRFRARGDATEVARLTAVIRPRLADDLLYVYDGDPILYYLTGSRLPTPFAFPHHLASRSYGAALGVDPAGEVRRVMAEHPSVVVAMARPSRASNRTTWRILHAALARDYRAVAAVAVHRRVEIVYARTGAA